MKSKAFIKNFSVRRSTYQSEIIFVTRFLVFSDEGEVALGYNVWAVAGDNKNLSQNEIDELNFDTFIGLVPSPKPLYVDRASLKNLQNSIIKAYPEANLSEFDNYSFILKGAPFIAWWETEGKYLKLKTQEIDMTKV